MATIYVPGGRRSSAPTVQTTVPKGTAVSLNPSQATAPAIPSAAQILGVLPAQSGQTGSKGSGNGSIATAGTSSISPRQVAGLGTLLGALGTLSRDSELSKAGTGIGLAAGLASANSPADIGMTVAPAIASKLGLPGGVFSTAAGAVKGDIGMMATGALAMASPQLAAVNALLGLFGMPTLGTAVNSALTPDLGTGVGLQAPATAPQDSGLEGAISSELGSISAAPTSGSSNTTGSGGNYGFGSFGNRSDMGGGTGIGGNTGFGLGLRGSFGGDE